MEKHSGFFARLFDLSFSEFITTKIVRALYVVAMVGAGLGSLVPLVGGFASRTFGGILLGLILTPVLFVLYVTLARVWLETLIVLFRIAENIQKMAGRNGGAPE